MRFFTKLVFICNICFIASILLRFIEMYKRSKGNNEPAIPLQPLESMLVVLGYGAIFLNTAFFLLWLLWLARGKIKLIPRWLILVNLVLLPVQVWYFFFSNF